MKRNITPLLFGIIFLLGGLVYILSLLFGYDFDIFFDGWWTLFIIVPSFISLLTNGPRAFNLSAMSVGVILLLAQLDIISDFNMGRLIVALVIISIGISLVSRFFYKPRNNNYTSCSYNINPDQAPPYGANPAPPYGAEGQDAPPHGTYTPPNSSHFDPNKSYDQQNYPTYNAILSGTNQRNNSPNLEGSRISAILGGVEIDFRESIITKDITIYATAIMGGIDIFAPQNVRIAINKTDILGGTDCTAYTQPPDANVPIVTFVTTTIMGGIDIK